MSFKYRYKHCYEPIPDNWDEQGENTVKKCCTTDRPDEPECGDSCYSNWRAELKTVLKSYHQEKEAADQIQKKLNLISERKSKYRQWLDEINKAEELARMICYQLEIISGQTRKVWYSASKATEAIELLFCMVRKFFQEVDYLKLRYDELWKCIEKNTHPSLEGGKGIIECLKKYLEKLEAIIKTRDDIVKFIVETIKLANLLQNNIYTKTLDPKLNPCDPEKIECVECKDASAHEYGFLSLIIGWYCELDCHNDCPPTSGPCADKPPKDSSKGNNPSAQQSYQQKRPTPPPPPPPSDDKCGDKDCELVPILQFPICNSEYKGCVTGWWETDDCAVKQLSDDLKEKNKVKEGLLACKTSLEKAITEADPANKCK